MHTKSASTSKYCLTCHTKQQNRTSVSISHSSLKTDADRMLDRRQCCCAGAARLDHNVTDRRTDTRQMQYAYHTRRGQRKNANLLVCTDKTLSTNLRFCDPFDTKHVIQFLSPNVQLTSIQCILAVRFISPPCNCGLTARNKRNRIYVKHVM